MLAAIAAADDKADGDESTTLNFNLKIKQLTKPMDQLLNTQVGTSSTMNCF